MKTDDIRKETGKSIPEKNNQEENIPELPPKKKKRPRIGEEEIMEDEKPIPEIEKTHKHVHKVQTPVAGTKNNKTAG